MPIYPEHIIGEPRPRPARAIAIPAELRRRLDALVEAVKEDPCRDLGKSEWEQATNNLARAWERRDPRLPEYLSALDAADALQRAEEVAEIFAAGDEPDVWPEDFDARLDRLGKYLAPADVTAGRVLAYHLRAERCWSREAQAALDDAGLARCRCRRADGVTCGACSEAIHGPPRSWP